MFKIKKYPNKNFVNEYLHFNERGIPYWKVSNSNVVKIGDVAGTLNLQRRRVVQINGERYYSSRLHYISIHGSIPETIEVGHKDKKINKDGTNDNINNLRLATHKENHRDRRSKHYRYRKSWKKGKQWEAYMFVDNKVHSKRVGTEKEAIELVKEFKNKYHKIPIGIMPNKP